MTYNYFGKEQKIEYEKLKNGLRVYVAPNKYRKNYHVEIVVNYGSEIKTFIPVGEKEYLTLPLGVAHFLEHKMFDMQESNAFDFFAKSGTYVNAGTNYQCTKYYIDGKTNFKKNFDYLLTMVMNPYFVNELVDSEKGIIAEEIKMYDDEATWQLDNEFNKCFYQNIYQEKIAGSVESIMEINADILQKTYKTFYQPSNIFIVAAGNITMKKVLEIIQNNKAISFSTSNLPIVFQEEAEPIEVRKEYQLLENINLIYPKMKYLFKIDLDSFGLKRLLARCYLNMLFSFLLGTGSKFENIIEEKKIASYTDLERNSYENIYAVGINAESEYADLVKEEVDNIINNIQITEEDFERIKKLWFSGYVRGLDSVLAVTNGIIDNVLRDEEEYDKYELLNKLNYQDLLMVIKKLDLSQKTFILMIPKENV